MKVFKSHLEFCKHFDTDKKCRAYLEKYRWQGVPTCPHCGCTDVCRFKTGKLFKCREKACRKKFSVTVGTVMESSKLPLTKWFEAIYRAMNHSKGISSKQLAHVIDVPQKTAWFLLHRIREITNQRGTVRLSNIVEVDETYYGAKSKNMHSVKRKEFGKKRLRGRSLEDKIPIVGLVERGGNMITVPAIDTKAVTLKPLVKKWIEAGAIVLTDEYKSYRGIDRIFEHRTVNHAGGEYVNGKTHTNTVEGFWSIYKRCIYGIYHAVSKKHIGKYSDEITFRYNTRKFTQDVRFSTVITRCNGRLKYDDLIQGYGPNLDESLDMQGQRALQMNYTAAELISLLKHGNVNHALDY